MEYDQDNYYWDINVATKLYHFEILGKRLGDPELKVWGSVRDVSDETAEWRRRAANWLYNRRIVTCTELSPPDIDRIIDEINAFPASHRLGLHRRPLHDLHLHQPAWPPAACARGRAERQRHAAPDHGRAHPACFRCTSYQLLWFTRDG